MSKKKLEISDIGLILSAIICNMVIAVVKFFGGKLDNEINTIIIVKQARLDHLKNGGTLSTIVCK